MNPIERTALEAFAAIHTPLHGGWKAIEPGMVNYFDPTAMAYGVAFVGEDPTLISQIDWAVCLNWDGWLLVLDDSNQTVPVGTVPPEILAHVLGEGARTILNRLSQQG
jgi:hypothetical protein